ncbi:MAG: hypothetical protein H8E44_02550 [Planctomycetes bacterium]|nr:hypothetical protein [Planctomycetota bacterium]MBL7044920.1 hypothetical protein [Pirellulaceae bacterium]
MNRFISILAMVMITFLLRGARAETIHDHFGLDEDAVVQVTVSYVPRFFTTDEGTSGTSRDPQLIATITDILKRLPAAGETQQRFRQEMGRDRRIIELHTSGGKKHRLKILGTGSTNLVSPLTAGDDVYGVYGTTDSRKQELRLFDLIRPIPDTGLVWGKPSGGLQCRLAPETQAVTVAHGDGVAEVYLTLELRNVGQKAVMFLPWYTPLEEISGDIFQITGPGGGNVRYLGEYVDRAPPDSRQFVRIAPGMKVTRRFRLPYDFTEPGRYSVKLKPRRAGWLEWVRRAYYGGDEEKARENGGNVWSGELASNTVSINVVRAAESSPASGATDAASRGEATKAADSIHKHFGFSGDPVTAIRISHAPKGDFEAKETAFTTITARESIAEFVEVLKSLPPSGTVWKIFPKDIEQWRIEMRTATGKTHVLTFFGRKLRSPQTKGGSFYGELRMEKHEQRLLRLVHPMSDNTTRWGEVSGGLQCRLLPEKQTVAVKPDQKAYDLVAYLTFELQNVGGCDVRLLPWYTPIPLAGIGYPMFEVIGQDGKEVQYAGPCMDRPPATPRDYIRIPPAVKLTRRCWLPYDLTKPGPYQVTFRMLMESRPDDWYYEGDIEKAKENPDNVWAGELVSNAVTVQITQTPDPISPRSR